MLTFFILRSIARPGFVENFSTHVDANALGISRGSGSRPRFNTVRLTNVRVFLFLTLVINLPTWMKEFAHERTVIVRTYIYGAVVCYYARERIILSTRS